MQSKTLDYFDIAECVAAKANLKEEFAVRVSEINLKYVNIQQNAAPEKIRLKNLKISSIQCAFQSSYCYNYL